jgi:hypothetical protein
MASQHMDPAEAVRGFRLLGARQALGYHWGTFRLTNEGIERPQTDLAAVLAGAGVDPGPCRVSVTPASWTRLKNRVKRLSAAIASGMVRCWDNADRSAWTTPVAVTAMSIKRL